MRRDYLPKRRARQGIQSDSTTKTRRHEDRNH
jgi:hypothetical protein